MCTVSFIARKSGCLLAMNRDEKLSRAKGLPPKISLVGGRRVLFPSEPGGGTWISLNDARVAFALINWYSIEARVKTNPVSRGIAVKSVAAEISGAQALEILAALPLKRINPFRLVGVFADLEEVYEWRWDLKTLGCHRRGWKSQQWISSGYDEPEAQRIRSAVFRTALRQESAGNPGWLRRLHRSHAPDCGPFSTCMHRHEAATVSYTEINISRSSATMEYYNHAPCGGVSGVMRDKLSVQIPSCGEVNIG